MATRPRLSEMTKRHRPKQAGVGSRPSNGKPEFAGDTITGPVCDGYVLISLNGQDEFQVRPIADPLPPASDKQFKVWPGKTIRDRSQQAHI